jgi:DNA-binding transcriptional MerR regulator
MSALLIGELAARSGLKPQTIRYYERLGILSRPARTAAGYRRYDEQAVEELALVKAARSLGFSLNEVKDILGVVRTGPARCSPVLEVARRRLAELDNVLASMKQTRTALAAAIDRCGPRPCTITLSRLASSVIGQVPRRKAAAEQASSVLPRPSVDRRGDAR